MSPQTLLTTNTSTLSVTAMMAVLQAARPGGRAAFLQSGNGDEAGRDHPRLRTSDTAISTLNEFCKKLGKDPVIVQDTTGFIVNRLLTPYMLSAIRFAGNGYRHHRRHRPPP